MILVTGASGTVGSEVVSQLQAARARFRAGYHSAAKATEATARGIDAVTIDYRQPETLRDAFRDVDRVFLLSASAPDLEMNAVKAAKEAGVKHIVKLSVWGAEGEEFSFAKMHRPVEKAIEASGVSWTFLRSNGFMQNMSNFNAGTIKGQGAFYGSTGDGRISHVDVRDIAAVAVKVLTEPGHEGKSYELTGPEALSNNDIAGKISAASGRPVRYVDLPGSELKNAMIGMGIPEGYADALLDLSAYYKQDKASRVTNDVRRLIGRDPIPFDQYAKDYAQAFK